MKRAPKSVESTPINKKYFLIQSIKDVIQSHQLIPYGGCVLVGVSGGPDSIALLDVLYHLRHELGIRIVVAHFHHRIRREATRDETFVNKIALKYQLPFVSERAKNKPPVTGSIEDWARKERYDFFLRAARKYQALGVILAHTADDLAETVLMRVIRGSGLHGLKGMGERRVICHISILRPMLNIRKKDVYEYLASRKLEYCVDQTNAATKFFRNKIRLDLIPLLEKEYNANMTGALVNLSRSAADDYDFLYQQAKSLWPEIIIKARQGAQGIQINIKLFEKFHPALKRMLIRMVFEQLKGDLNLFGFEHVERIEQLLFLKSGRVELPAGMVAEKNKNLLRFIQSRAKS